MPAVNSNKVQWILFYSGSSRVNSRMAAQGLAGLGAETFTLAIYIANRPALDSYPQLCHLQPLAAGEIAHIVAHTSNHWRKVFNVLAKFVWELDQGRRDLSPSWQHYREQNLLQAQSREALLFSAPDLDQPNCIHIIAGKTWAADLCERGAMAASLHWLDAHFAIDLQQRLIVCPYPDYRQLSNARISQLVALVQQIEP